MNKLLALAFLATTTTTSLVHAESLEEKTYWKKQMDYINKAVEKTDKACDLKLTFEFVDKDKLRTEAEKNKNSANGICGAIIEEVASLCRKGEDEKTAVKAKIKGFQCGFAKPRTLDLKGGLVTY
ncbi:MAG: hypothetical protein ABIY55_12575, partial [Kofleriaceae bacterium]